MPVAPTITFRRLKRSDELEAAVLSHVRRLERYVPSLIAARVLVELAARHHRTGNRCHVRIDLSVPGEDIIVTHDASLRPELRARATAKAQKQHDVDRLHRHASVAIREAFEVARRRAQDRTRRRRGAVKTHTPQPSGRVVRLFPDEGYGFVETADGREIYFHKKSVLDGGFTRLKVGSKVAFAEESGDEGPQASTVRRVR